jgi:hypothetical protein
LIGGLAAGVLACVSATESRGGSLTVNAGYDLFRSIEGTTFPDLGPLEGVPLGTYDFGSGAVGVGNTDTIVHRLSDVTVAAIGDTGTTRLEMLALQLKTVAPVDPGTGLDTYYVTLQSIRGGPASVGSMDITFNSLGGGTFSSFFDVFFDVRKGALDGAIVLSDHLVLTNDATPWNRDAPPGAVIIDGVNHFLNGQNNDMDFWPIPPLVEVEPTGAQHVVTYATPEPSSWLLAGTALVVGLGCARRRRGA